MIDGYRKLVRTRPDWFSDPEGAPIRFTSRPPAGTIGYADPYITVVVDRVSFPGGRLGRYVRVMLEPKRTEGVAILPLMGDQVLLVRQFRHAVRDWRLEIPRGFGERAQDPEANARRELLEETGFEAASVERLGTLEPDTGLLGMRVHLFRAMIDPAAVQGQVEAGLEVRPVSRAEFRRMIACGDITDSFSIAAWARAELG
jgi:ADP-ribose pyrophosphatase